MGAIDLNIFNQLSDSKNLIIKAFYNDEISIKREDFETEDKYHLSMKALVSVLLSATPTQIIDIISPEYQTKQVNAANIPQFSNLSTAMYEVPRLLLERGLSDVKYADMGGLLWPEKRKLGADMKYGENHSKTAALIGLTSVENATINLTSFGRIFLTLNSAQQAILIPMLWLKVPLFQNYFCLNKNINQLNSDMSCLSESTSKRRLSNVKTIIDIIKNGFYFYDDSEKNKLDSKIDSVINNRTEPLQLIYYGAPGTGKSHAIDGVISEDNSLRTTFHPDSDYASFVGAYKPTMASVAMSAFVGKEVHKAQPQGGHPGTEQKIVYKYVPQAFLKAYVQAWAKYNPENDEPYYLVIEEINRGNCAQIFGDLFQLLDRNNMGASSYPISADDDIEQFLATDEKGFAGFSEEQKDVIRNFVLVKDNGKTESIGQSILNGSKLLLPPNLRIWATMNTSDQSLFPIDSAFKRRWNWKHMPIEYKPVDHNGNIISWTFMIGESQYSWGAFLEKINPEIYSLTESSDKQMGYFFAKADPQTGIISEDVFLNKVLFYLWTDVFKDYDVSSAVFKNKEENRSFRFTDFFEDPEALGNFIENLGLTPLDENDNIGDLEESNSAGFSLNGEALSLKDIANKVVSNYATEHPELTGEAIRDTFVSLCKGIGVSHIVESDEDYQKRRHQPSAERSRTAVTLPNGETIHVTTQWRANKPDSNFIKFIEICKEHNLGIIERIVE